MDIFKFLFAPILAAAMATGPVSAQDQSVALSGDVMLEKATVGSDGSTTTELVEPTTIVPGDRLVFGTDYTNTSSETVENFVVTNPLPEAVRLAPDAPADLTVSVDGGATWGTLSGLSIPVEGETPRPAEHADVTHVRWTLATVAAGASGRVEYPAIIR
ncbi:MAG: hypothetical protein AB3N06_01825 [Erythrobacter sp.]